MTARGLCLSPRAIFSPVVDLLLTSGISIVVMAALIVAVLSGVLPTTNAGSAVLPKLLLLQVLLNWPHFMVSYRLLYHDRRNLSRFPMAAVGVPVILLAVCIAAVLPAFGGEGPMTANVSIAYILWIFAALYLAWHYTGQTWGVMMIFARLSGMTFTRSERFILQGGFRVLIAWHVIWGLGSLPQLPYVGPLQGPIAQLVVNTAAILSAMAGVLVWVRKLMAKDVVDMRSLGAWIAIYSWYLVLWLIPDAFIFVQLSHALQYLIFPARIELNRNDIKRSATAMRTFLIYLACVFAGLLVFYLPEVALLSPTGAPTIFALLAIAINIHHYYTDSAIWKLRDKSVRDSLFGHVSG
jgi:hypothetical protein